MGLKHLTVDFTQADFTFPSKTLLGDYVNDLFLCVSCEFIMLV